MTINNKILIAWSDSSFVFSTNLRTVDHARIGALNCSLLSSRNPWNFPGVFILQNEVESICLVNRLSAFSLFPVEVSIKNGTDSRCT